tara:strand:- start:118 stop:342 length:225 start_codon:yes stop_codon:yes gene_type:complete
MATVTITLRANNSVVDDGGNYEEVSHANIDLATDDLVTREAHYKRNRGDDGIVNVINQSEGGVISVSPVRKEDA